MLKLMSQLTEGTILEGPHWTEPVKMLTAKARGSRIELQAVNMIRDVHWDLVIVDEAHKMAAHRYGTKVNKKQRYVLGEFLRDHTDHYRFLTATPHKGDPDNFALLRQLLCRRRREVARNGGDTFAYNTFRGEI